ncbi:deoxyribonuclease-1-like [Ornithorhynchus anatinus]|uniref:deoxyribonuclease-1-like n=1 Tax=Ornithorhynchus anatinus TaxID=9258 RepID=UPI0019D4B68B|nr:deoxyribonuclease-1-like [Ornithorhynchus anatinus]
MAPQSRRASLRGALLLLLFGHLAPLATTSPLRICAFNIQSFGEAKAGRPRVMGVLVKVVARCDICVVQEVRDAKGEAIPALVRKLNRYDPAHHYAHLESGRLGHGRYKEQNVFIYRADVVTITDWYQYPEPSPEQPGAFARQPFIARFHSPTTAIQDFVLVSHHACPRNAPQEIDQLYQVFQEVQRRWRVEDIMLLGDLNAACAYVPLRAWPGIKLHSHCSFHWLIGDDQDTTVSSKTHCAYDRIVVHGEALLQAIVPGSAKPYNFKKQLGLSEEEALEVSDHYPVEVVLRAAGHKHQEF